MDAIRQLPLFARPDLGNALLSLLWTLLLLTEARGLRLLTEAGGLRLLTETSGLRLRLALWRRGVRHTGRMARLACHLVRRLPAAHPLLFALRFLGALCVTFCSLRALRIRILALSSRRCLLILRRSVRLVVLRGRRGLTLSQSLPNYEQSGGGNE